MKELEALNDLLWLSKLSDGGKKGMSALKRADYNAYIIYRALTPPTADEVCKALNTDNHLYPKIFFYDEISKTFKEIHISKNEEIVSYYANGTITINPNYGIPPHIITMIGKFYESLEE